MATSSTTGLRYADLPAVSVARFPDNPEASRFAEQVRQIIATRFGKSGQPQDRAVTWGDLVESGIVAMRRTDGRAITVPSTSGTFLPITSPEIDGTPPAPTGVTVTAGLATIIVEWDKPAFSYFGYAEIWRSTTDNLAQAIQVGQTTAYLYADPLSSSATYYFWIRFISKGGKPGPFNAVGGVAGTTSLDPAYLIDVLSADDPNALLYEIPEDTEINGVPVLAGIYMRDLYVANGSMTNLKLANLAVDDAKIANVSAVKVTFGEMSGDRIKANTLNADRITVNSLVARLAVIATAYVGTANIIDGNITAAKIGAAQIGYAHIIDGNITNAKIGDGQITYAKIGAAQVGTAHIIDGNITNAKIGDAQISTAKIGTAQVDRLRLAGQSATVSAAYYDVLPMHYKSGGSGEPWEVVASHSLYLPEAGSMLLFLKISQAYGAYSSYGDIYVKVYMDGVQIPGYVAVFAPGGRMNDEYISISLTAPFIGLAAGTHTVTVYSKIGPDGTSGYSSYYAMTSEMFLFSSMR